jgi:hypothetical protein
MRVAACIVTRGNVSLTKIIDSIPDEWEVVVWDNSKQDDLAVYGRYAAIELTDADVIYVQDDDCVLEPAGFDTLLNAYRPGALTANMPERFRHDFYTDHCLVGFGAIFDRDLPNRAFGKFFTSPVFDYGGEWIDFWTDGFTIRRDEFMRTCDIVFTSLTKRILVDVAHSDLPWASAPDRMWKQPEHVPERAEMRKLVAKCR